MATTVSLPPLPKKSAIRRMIEVWAEGKQLNMIVRLGMGHGYMVPSRTELGAFYVVFHREEDDTWACSCKGFRYNKRRDACYHVELVIEKEKVASKKWKSSGSKSSTPTARKKSSTAVARSGSSQKSSPKARPTRTSQRTASQSSGARSSSPSRKRS